VRVRNRGYCRVNNRRLPPSHLTKTGRTNTPLIGRNSPPKTAGTTLTKIRDETEGIKLASEFLSLV